MGAKKQTPVAEAKGEDEVQTTGEHGGAKPELPAALCMGPEPERSCCSY